MTNTSFLGFTPVNPRQIISYENKFDVLHDDAGQMTLITKKTYSMEADGDMPAFEYKYILNCFDMYALGSENHTIVIECLLCPLFEYIKANVVKNITDKLEYYYDDAAVSGALPKLGDEYIDYNPKDIPPDDYGNQWEDYYYHLTDNADFHQTLNVAATVLDNADAMRGFSFDKTWNRIGSTGWDLLESLLVGTDWIKVSINRIYGKELSL